MISAVTLAVPSIGANADPISAPTIGKDEVVVRLLSPSGALVPGVEARLMILDGLVRGQRITPTYSVTPDARGWTRFAFPEADPYVAAHPAQRVFNVEATIAVPVAGGHRAVTAVTFVYDRALRREVTVVPVSGRTITVPVVPVSPVNVPTVATDPLSCVDRDAYEYVCAEVEYPANMRSVPTVLAYNAGAGFDTTLTLTYDHAGRVQTTTAHDFGAGIVEVEGATTVDNNDTSKFTYGGGNVLYGNTNEWAIVNTAWSRTTRYYCRNHSWPFTGTPTCEEDGYAWNPHQVTGSDQTASPDPDDNPLWHDRLCVFDPECDPPDNLCVTTFARDYELGHGTQRHRKYEAGVDLHGEIHKIDLHASATYTREEDTGETTVYAYKATSPTAYEHALFVHTDLAYDKSLPGGGICPEVNIGDAWTTTSYTVGRPNPDDANQPVDTVSQAAGNPAPSQAYRRVGRCAYVPDDCRP